MSAEIPLTGGRSRAGVVRVSDTVRRPLTERSPYVHAVLRRLERAGAVGSPRLLGTDDRGREVLSYLEGRTGHGLGRLDDATLTRLVVLVRGLHDALAGSPEAGLAETVCHHDLAPWNLVLRDGVPVGFIDFDGVAPGRRCDDVAYLLWTFLDVGDSAWPVAEQARLMRLCCDAYADAGSDRVRIHAQVLPAMLRAQARILRFRCDQARSDSDPDVAEFASVRAEEIVAAMAWLRTGRAQVQAVLTGCAPT